MMGTTLEIIKTLSQIIAAIVIPLVVVVIGNKLSKNIREREIRTKYIEMAIDVLKEMPEEDQAPMRKWAIDIINHYSEIPLPEEARERLIKDAPLTSERLFETQKNFYDKFYGPSK